MTLSAEIDAPAAPRPGPGPRTPVRRRHVLYVAGFDPRRPAHYHRLYRDNARLQAEGTGATIEVGPCVRLTASSSAWTVDARYGPHAVRTEYEICRWDELVRAHSARHGMRLAAAMLAGHARLARMGHLRRVLRLSRNFFFALNYPVALLYLMLAAAGVAGVAMGLSLADMTLPPGTASATGLAFAYAVLALLLRGERRWNLAWLGRIGLFSLARAEHGVPAFDVRAAAIGRRIRALAAEPALDEVLVVGHSVGSELSLLAVAAAIEPGPPAAPISYLTLGTTIPMHALLPGAGRFREALARVAASPAVEWVDVSAPPDAACFALVDPVEAAGIVRPAGAPLQPKLVSARFARLFRPETYRRLRRDWYGMHFLYLGATEMPGTYDYFAITAGERRLAERFAGIPSERSFTRLRGRLIRRLFR